MARRLLLLLSEHTYRASAFLAAAERLRLEVTIGSDRRPALAQPESAAFLEVDFEDSSGSMAGAVEFARRNPIHAVVAAEDEEVVTAAEISAALGLPHSPPMAVATARDKLLSRQAVWRDGLLCPPFEALTTRDDPRPLAAAFPYPCVLKPTRLSASRGVIRADSPDAFFGAFQRIAAILEPGGDGSSEGRNMVLAEGYIPGVEVALEALLTRGSMQPLAVFDKPEPMEGPYFEESLYVTPSRLPQPVQKAAWDCAAASARAMGLTDGPIHAEVRLNPAGAWLIELAPRSIGGWCSRSLRFVGSLSLEDVILRHALGFDVRQVRREARASGVMMLPIPEGGVLQGVQGLEQALALPGIEDIRIAVPAGQRVEPLPEGNRYLGFAFARADTPQEVEDALRGARARLTIQVTPTRARQRSRLTQEFGPR